METTKLTKANIAFLQSIEAGTYYKTPWRASTDSMRGRLQNAGFVCFSGDSTGHGQIVLTDSGRAAIAKATGSAS